MVARCDQVCAAGKQVLRGGGRNAVARRGIFAVDDADVNPVQLFERGEMCAQECAASRTDNVADSEDIHAIMPFCAGYTQ
jgi:hypothetical protein